MHVLSSKSCGLIPRPVLLEWGGIDSIYMICERYSEPSSLIPETPRWFCHSMRQTCIIGDVHTNLVPKSPIFN